MTHQINVQIAETLEELQHLNPDLYGIRYSKLYPPHGDTVNWNVKTLYQLQQDLIENIK